MITLQLDIAQTVGIAAVLLVVGDLCKKYISVFNAERKEEKISISTIDDIFEHRDRIISSAKNYLS